MKYKLDVSAIDIFLEWLCFCKHRVCIDFSPFTLSPSRRRLHCPAAWSTTGQGSCGLLGQSRAGAPFSVVTLPFLHNTLLDSRAVYLMCASGFFSGCPLPFTPPFYWGACIFNAVYSGMLTASPFCLLDSGCHLFCPCCCESFFTAFYLFLRASMRLLLSGSLS